MIAEYRLWLWGKIKEGDSEVLCALRLILEQDQLLGRLPVKLGCWYSPKAYHCDVLIAALRSERVIGILDERIPL